MTTIGAQLSSITHEILETEKKICMKKDYEYFNKYIIPLLFHIAKDGSTVLIINVVDDPDIFKYIQTHFEHMTDICNEEDILLLARGGLQILTVTNFEFHWQSD